MGGLPHKQSWALYEGMGIGEYYSHFHVWLQWIRKASVANVIFDSMKWNENENDSENEIGMKCNKNKNEIRMKWDNHFIIIFDIVENEIE